MSIEAALFAGGMASLSGYSWELLKEVLKKQVIETDYLKNLEAVIDKSLSAEIPPRHQQLSKLISAYDNERLVLVLGAGVSTEYGLPNWDSLLQNLLLSSFETETKQSADKSLILAKFFTKLFAPNPLIAARYLRHHYQNNGDAKTSFDSSIRDTLYRHLDKKKKSETLSEIVQLCVAPGKSPNLDSIITFNYDDILESHLATLDISVPHKIIHDVGQRPTPGELAIYHVHGFLPRDGDIKADKITLSEDVYHAQYSDTYSWNNMIQLLKYRDSVCLFIGLSLTDPNLRRLLDIAKIQRGDSSLVHFSIRKKYNSTVIEESLTQLLKQNPDLLDQKAKAQLKLEESVQHLVNVIEKFETNDDLSFGISTIWIDKYEDIPVILKAIRQKDPRAHASAPKTIKSK